MVNFKFEYEKPYLNIFISYSTRTEEIKGYLDKNGNIKTKTDELTMQAFKELNTNINFEIYFSSIYKSMVFYRFN